MQAHAGGLCGRIPAGAAALPPTFTPHPPHGRFMRRAHMAGSCGRLMRQIPGAACKNIRTRPAHVTGLRCRFISQSHAADSQRRLQLCYTFLSRKLMRQAHAAGSCHRFPARALLHTLTW
eukprot:gene9235-biopygen34